MYQERITERRQVVGLFCELKRGRSVNQRWTVYFNGDEIGKFRTRSLAKQFAESRIWAAMQDMVALEGFTS